MKPIRLASLVVLLSPASRTQAVRIVDAAAGGPGALQAAVNASAPGDILRIRPGSYTRTTIGRGLHLLAEPSADCEQLVVQGLPANETLSIVGVNLSGVPGTDNRPGASPLRVEGCQGHVVFSFATIRGRQDTGQPRGFGLPVPVAAPAVNVSAATLHIEAATIQGADGQQSTEFVAFIAGRAIEATADARVTSSDCTLRGGFGGVDQHTRYVCQWYTGQEGAAALKVDRAFMVLDRCQTVGGSGAGPVVSWACEPCGGGSPQTPSPAGPAAQLANGGELVVLGQSSLTAGQSGRNLCGAAGPVSAVVTATTGSVTADPQAAIVPEPGAPPLTPGVAFTQRPLPSLENATPRAGLSTRTLWIHRDQPGAYAFFLLSAGFTAWLPHAAVLGGLDVDPAVLLVFGPVIVPPAGWLTFAFDVPADPGLRGGRLALQSLGIDAQVRPAASAVSAFFVDF
jgi:hypothetical protein